MPRVLYSRLQNDEFRLLQVFCKKNRVSCRMKIFSLDLHSNYTALSHAWDNSGQFVSIPCNGKMINLSRELLAAFRAFRECPSLHTPVWIWVDSICINQDDDAEKNTQIGMMDRIYKGAEIVTIWTGTGKTRTQESLSTLERFAVYIGVCPPIRSLDTVIALSGHPQWEELDEFFRRRWFTRSWVIQEVLLARKVRLVCGTTPIEWGTVTGIYLSCLEESQSNNVMLRRNELGYDIIKPFYDLSRGQGSCSYDLELLNLIRQRQCGRPVDKVYSILGLISGEVRAKMVVDSSVHHWPLLIRFAQELLRHHGPDIFILAPSTERTPELPSWVPNLLSPSLMTHKWYRHKAGQLEKATDPDCDVPDESTSCTVRIPGVCMSTIDSIYPLPDISAGIRNEATVDEILEVISLYHTLCGRRDRQIKLEDQILALIGGVIARRPGLERQIKDEYKEMIRHLESFRRGDPFDTPNTHFVQSLADTWKGACLFTAQGGHVGFGPRTMQRGDKICIFFRAATPFVLRSKGDGDTYQMLGPAYIHEFMDGTAFKARNPRQKYDMFAIS